jgi:outer membrane protein assembly factor BamB
MSAVYRAWEALAVSVFLFTGSTFWLNADESNHLEKIFLEADKKFVEGDFIRGESLLNDLIAKHPGEFDLATKALRRICLSEYLKLIDTDWPSSGYPNQLFRKSGGDYEKMWEILSQHLREGFLVVGKFGGKDERYSEDPRERPYLLESLWRNVKDYPLTPLDNMSDAAAERILTLRRSGYLEVDDPAVIDASILLVFIRKSQRRNYEAATLADELVVANNRQIDWLLARAALHARIKSPKADFFLRELFAIFEKPGVDPILEKASKRASKLNLGWPGFAKMIFAEGLGWLGQMIPDNQNRAWDRVGAGLINGSEKDIDLWIQSTLGSEQSKVYMMRRDETGSATAWSVLDDKLKSMKKEDLRGLRKFQESRCRTDPRANERNNPTQEEKLALFRRFPWAKTAHRTLIKHAQAELEAGRGQSARRSFRDVHEHADDPDLINRSRVGLWLSIAQSQNHEELEKLFADIDSNEQFPWMNETATSQEIQDRLMKGINLSQSAKKAPALSDLGIQFLKLPARPLWPPMKYRSSPGVSFVHLQKVDSHLLVSTRNLLAWYAQDDSRKPLWVDTARGGHGDHSVSRMGRFRPIVIGNMIYTRWGYRADPLKLVAMKMGTREIIWGQNLADSPKAKRVVSLGNPVSSGGQIYFVSAWDEHRNNGRFQLQLSCVEASTGKVNWRRDLSVSSQNFFEGVFGESLSVHDGSIYCSPSTGFVGRFDARDGQMEWMYNYESLSRTQLTVDTRGDAPLIAGDIVVSLPRDTNVMVGLDKHTGKRLWSSALPLALEIIGLEGQEVLVQGPNALASINATSGNITWHSPYPDKILGKATLQNTSIYLASKERIYRYDAITGIERETRPLPKTRNTIRNVSMLDQTIYLITDEPSDEKESSFVRNAPGGTAWEVTAHDPKLYIPKQEESSSSEILIHENDMLHCLEANPSGKVLWQRFAYPRPQQIFFVEGKAVLLYNKGRYDLYLKALDQKTGNLEWDLTIDRLRAGHGAIVGRSGKYLYGKDNSDRFHLIDLSVGKMVLQNRIPRKNGQSKAGFGGGKVHFLVTPAYRKNLHWFQWDIANNEIGGLDQVLHGRDGDSNKAFDNNWVDFAKFGEHACYFISRREGEGRQYSVYRADYKDRSVRLLGRNTRNLKFEPPYIFMQQQESEENRKNRTHQWTIQKEDNSTYAHSLNLGHAWYHKPTFINGRLLDVRTPVRGQNPYMVRVHDLNSKRMLLEHRTKGADAERMGGVEAGPNHLLIYEWKRNNRGTEPYFKLSSYDLNTGQAGSTMEIDYWTSNNQHPTAIQVVGNLILINDRYSVKAWELKM